MFLTQLGPTVPPEEWTRLRHEVSFMAGQALPAYNRHGGLFDLRNAAYVVSNVSPVANWEYTLRDPEQFPPETVISAIDSAIGLAESKATEAESREKGLVGVIAAFLRWPTTLRDAVGPDHAAQRGAAGVLGVFAQVVIGVVATLIASGLVAGIVEIWQALR